MINNTFQMINETTETLTIKELSAMYNYAVETIWILEERIRELSVENEVLWKSYEELSDELYG